MRRTCASCSPCERSLGRTSRCQYHIAASQGANAVLRDLHVRRVLFDRVKSEHPDAWVETELGVETLLLTWGC